MVHLSHPYRSTGKTLALTNPWLSLHQQCVSLLFNMLSRLVTAFLPRSKHLLISWLQSPSTVILESKKIKSVTTSTFSPCICQEVRGLDALILVFWCWVSSQSFHSPLSPLLRCSLVPSRIHRILCNDENALYLCHPIWQPGGSEGKESACKGGDPGSITGSGRSPGERNEYPLQYSRLENSMDRGAWWATVHGVTKRWTQLSNWV